MSIVNNDNLLFVVWTRDNLSIEQVFFQIFLAFDCTVDVLSE